MTTEVACWITGGLVWAVTIIAMRWGLRHDINHLKKQAFRQDEIRIPMAGDGDRSAYWKLEDVVHQLAVKADLRAVNETPKYLRVGPMPKAGERDAF